MPIDGIRPGLLPVPGQSAMRPMFRTLGIAASGLSAQRQRMEIIAQNIANADVTSGPNGTPYKKRSVLMQTANAGNAAFTDNTPSGIAGTLANPVPPFGSPAFQVPALEDSRRTVQVPALQPIPTTGDGQFGVAVTGIAEQQSEGRKAYEPGHPDADIDGYVRYPDIDTTQETVNLYDAKRLYEANASVFQVAKSMLRASLDI
ncbi:MAG: flagellar basal body rod protein FlgC [Gemmatimonadota bacterium]|nr:flagellar basal body rod protein FlgC [Gemmatimonadota bacterium]